MPRPLKQPKLTPARLIAARQERQMTQKEFATFFGVTRQTIINWEGGKNRIPSMVQKVLNAS